MATWRLGRRPELDGLRGVAILLVVACHVGIVELPAAGAAGVTVFFTLSGFLITALLLQEHERTGTVRLRAFYRRRALRLLPALLFLLMVLGSVGLALGYGTRWLISDTAPVILYFANWSLMFGDPLGVWSHTWSLAVEEQFYLVWPLVVLAVARLGRRAVAGVAVAGIVYAVTARLVLWDGGAGLDRIYLGTDTRADGLLVGCLVGAWMHGSGDRAARPKMTAVLLAGVCALGVTGDGFAGMVVAPTLVPLLTAGILAGAACGDGVGWLRWRPLVFVGRRSYGLYLWHYPLIVAFVPLLPDRSTGGALTALAVAVGLTLLSWRYVEEPFLRHRSQGQDIRPQRVVGPRRAEGVSATV